MKLTRPNITPGDWHAEGDSVLSSKGEIIATCPDVFIFGEEKDNVKAIAALPELLKALEAKIQAESGYEQAVDLWDDSDLKLADEKIKQALTKAGFTIES